MDVLSEMLAALRLSGGVFVDAEFRAPWTVLSDYTPEDCAPFFEIPSQLIAYHYVRSGSFTCRIPGGPARAVHAGEIVILPHGTPHYLHGPAPWPAPMDTQNVLRTIDNGILRLRGGGDGASVSMYCGYLGTTTPDNTLLQSLPPMLVIGIDAAQGDWVARSIDFAAHGVATNAPEMVGKLAEGLFAEAVRRYVDDLPADERGWLAGLRDPAVGRALALIHQRFAEAWTLDALAREAAVSKTVLADRFRALLGEAPMQYCARWRMKAAAEMLRGNRHNASSVAYSVGFNSEAAFNRAFKREFGAPPATWAREAVAA
ncbi:AraC family transcriptional regulator [Sphingomonas sp. DG1-23]|uniref:AraC family transcriptional regulator n=1 Tax=Sphingomonas sp. DG1-23 TaxID=3068316 RepID=UPI00273D3968|nr:AraC family transcriptional regulator [Sphingomonas sp. DG1-23]MDP5279022.1 AraC family transcriptional regulator [Sphingomonas sp. DG1-23]